MSEQIKDGGPAFPVPDSDSRGYVECSHIGMTLRDYFAAKAMQGILAHPKCGGVDPELSISAAREAFYVADAMLAARETKS